MGEINTRGMIRSIFSTFPSVNDAECLNRQELLSGSGNLMNVSGGDTECAPMEAISFKAYPCKSQTDKAPLADDVLKFEIRNSLHHTIWFSSNVLLVELSFLSINGVNIKFSVKNIGVGEESANYGINVINRGDYLELYSVGTLNMPSGVRLTLPVLIGGLKYTINIDTL